MLYSSKTFIDFIENNNINKDKFTKEKYLSTLFKYYSL